MDKNVNQADAELVKTLKPYSVIVGEWDIAITGSQYWSHIVHGHVSIQPINGGSFLIRRSDYEQPGPPSAVSMIGGDEASALATVLYNDVRGVSRVLQTDIEDGVWKVWRDAPGFAQRLTGRLSDDGNTIKVRVEKSLDNSTWEHDFDINYTRSDHDV